MSNLNKSKATEKGYKLHINRVLYTGGEIIRTIKYPLIFENLNQESLWHTIKSSLIYDDQRIKGSLTYSSLSKNDLPYSLIDYWLDSLKLGVIFQPSSLRLVNFVERYYKSKTSFEEIFDSAREEIRKFFQKDLFIDEIILSDPKRNTSTKKSFAKSLEGMLKNEYLIEKYDENHKKIKQPTPEASFIINQICNSFYTENGNLKLIGEDQYKYWKEIWNINKPTSNKTSLTFFIIEQLISTKDSESIEDLIEKRMKLVENLYKNQTQSKITDEVLKFLGLSDNFNSFSNYFNDIFNKFVNNDTDTVINELIRIGKDFITKDKIIPIINKLAQKAKLLGLPKNTSSWAEYRSHFGGKLQSWFTNSRKRHEEIKEYKKNIISKFDSIVSEIKKYFEYENAQECISLLEQTKLLLSNISNSEGYELFHDSLSNLRMTLNVFFQKYLKKNEQDTINNTMPYKPLFETPPKPINFFGESRKKEIVNFINNTVPLANEGYDFVFLLLKDIVNLTLIDIEKYLQQYKKNIFEKNKNDEKLVDYDPVESYIRTLLQSIYVKYKENQFIHKSVNFFIKKLLLSTLDDSHKKYFLSEKDLKHYVFKANPYQKGVFNEYRFYSNNFAKICFDIINKLTSYLLTYKKSDLFENTNSFIDFVELSKILISKYILLKNPKHELSFYTKNLLHYSKLNLYKTQIKIDSIDRTKSLFVVNTLIFSVFKGAIQKLIKKYIIDKYTVQELHNDEKYPLLARFFITEPLSFTDDKFKLQFSTIKKKYYISFEKTKKQKTNLSFTNNEPSLWYLINKKFLHNPKLIDAQKVNLDFCLRISSSPYQTQFIDRIFYKPSHWSNIKLSLSEWFFIVEQKREIKWNVHALKPEFSDPVKEKLYISMPFNIKAYNKTHPLPVSNLYMGIDVGEYGLAYVCADFSFPDNPKIIDYGFIFEPLIGKIRDKYSALQQRSRLSDFSLTNNALANIRNHAVTSLRNVLHEILLKTRSTIVYEYQIMNFETGSGRVTKIYKSVKKADVPSQIEADKSVQQHVWGIKKSIGQHLSAYASSYSCVQCAKSLYSLKQEDVKGASIIDRKGNIIKFKLFSGEEILGYSKEKEFSVGYIVKNTKNDYKRVIKAIKDFARPPIVKFNYNTHQLEPSEVVSKYVFMPLVKLKDFRNQRGNSALFVCPFCQIFGDADIQAAFIMAVRAYIKKEKSLSKKSEDQVMGDLYLQNTLSYLSNLSQKPCFNLHVTDNKTHPK